jgi:hypothetical protein
LLRSTRPQPHQLPCGTPQVIRRELEADGTTRTGLPLHRCRVQASQGAPPHGHTMEPQCTPTPSRVPTAALSCIPLPQPYHSALSQICFLLWPGTRDGEPLNHYHPTPPSPTPHNHSPKPKCITGDATACAQPDTTHLTASEPRAFQVEGWPSFQGWPDMVLEQATCLGTRPSTHSQCGDQILSYLLTRGQLIEARQFLSCCSLSEVNTCLCDFPACEQRVEPGVTVAR